MKMTWFFFLFQTIFYGTTMMPIHLLTTGSHTAQKKVHTMSPKRDSTTSTAKLHSKWINLQMRKMIPPCIWHSPISSTIKEQPWKNILRKSYWRVRNPSVSFSRTYRPVTAPVTWGQCFTWSRGRRSWWGSQTLVDWPTPATVTILGSIWFKLYLFI